MAAGTEAPAVSRKPEDTAFKQQRLPAWQPILTPFWVIVSFTLIGLVFLPLGIVLKVESDSIVEYSVQYDGTGTPTANSLCHITTAEAGTACTVTMITTKEMKAPVYLYYQLDNFYQNHRRYVKSRSDAQLMGEQLTESELTDCDPLKTYNNRVLNPCGLIANSFFNDWYTLAGYTLDDEGIAWESDVDSRFAQVDGFEKAEAAGGAGTDCAAQLKTGATTVPYYEELGGTASYYCVYYPEETTYIYLYERYGTSPNPFPNLAVEGVTNEHFIVWMRTAGLPTFRKLYAKINEDIPAGTTLTFTIYNNFEVVSFGGKKSLVLSTVSWFGGRNDFLGLAYIIVGSICLALAMAFAAKQAICPRKLGDTRYLGWKEQ